MGYEVIEMMTRPPKWAGQILSGLDQIRLGPDGLGLVQPSGSGPGKGSVRAGGAGSLV